MKISSIQTIGIRFVVLYMAIQLLPLDGQFFKNLFDWSGDSVAYAFTRWLFNLSRYAPSFFGSTATFTNWAVVALLAGIGTLIWAQRSPNPAADERVYAWVRVAVRYRLAWAVIAYGFLKLFPIQAPLPSLSSLNTAYGDHSAWKLFSLSLGVVPGYQAFLGGVEVLGGLLLLHRKTTAIGTLILLPFLGNVFFSNLAYEGGEYIYSGLLLTFGLFLFGHDAARLFRLVSLERPARPNQEPAALSTIPRAARYGLKGAFLGLVVGVYGFTTAFTPRAIRYPQTPGLRAEGVLGLYRVETFKQDGQVIPYAKMHPGRWQDVVFEPWNTLSIRSNRPVTIHHVSTEELPAGAAQSDHELAGSQGRLYYRYTTDVARTQLLLQNANPHHATDRLRLRLTRAANNRLTLQGTDSEGHRVEATLVKVNKKYLQHEAAKAGRRGSLTL
ncbi:DoxX family protein [Rudanella paleaurantiibacter]|uniref:DoxX family protein n=1 Tax=Rudanella paleaurantiibacter TaxID=2614655 RepID=A0A7J5TW18_9BACT|nr:DoxX family protein [Rudanella paleaurantiibacter]KAB7727332.1 DoxX family protein [Rudanella paleaurantiibacter]